MLGKPGDESNASRARTAQQRVGRKARGKRQSERREVVRASNTLCLDSHTPEGAHPMRPQHRVWVGGWTDLWLGHVDCPGLGAHHHQIVVPTLRKRHGQFVCVDKFPEVKRCLNAHPPSDRRSFRQWRELGRPTQSPQRTCVVLVSVLCVRASNSLLARVKSEWVGVRGAQLQICLLACW
jgi:hypothetical protein